MSKRLWVIIAYLALLALSLPIPLLHHYQTVRVIEHLRPVLKLEDGSYEPLLLPGDLLFLRTFGQLSWCVPVCVFLFLLLSLLCERFRWFSTIVALALCQCAFTTFYAWYAISDLGAHALFFGS
jgi:hypothetical protein